MTTAADAARTAAAVDALFRAGRHEEVVAAARAVTPPGWADQADAAVNELDFGSQRLVDTPSVGARYDRAPYSEYPEWLTLGALSTLAAWGEGDAEVCMHAPSAARPQPVHGAAWRPGLIACPACLHLLQLPRGSTRDRRCDGCGQVCGPNAPITSAVVVLGVLVYSVGVCPSCTWLGGSS